MTSQSLTTTTVGYRQQKSSPFYYFIYDTLIKVTCQNSEDSRNNLRLNRKGDMRRRDGGINKSVKQINFSVRIGEGCWFGGA